MNLMMPVFKELLALGERIGYVSTGLSEEKIMSGLKQWKFVCIPFEEPPTGVEPCCICQAPLNLSPNSCIYVYGSNMAISFFEIQRNCATARVLLPASGRWTQSMTSTTSSAAGRYCAASFCLQAHHQGLAEQTAARLTPKAMPEGNLKRVEVDGVISQEEVTIVGPIAGEAEIIGTLCRNEDIFAWAPKGLPSVARSTMEQKLTVKDDAKPKKQKPRRKSVDRQEAAKAEVAKLLKAGIIREIKHSKGLANPIQYIMSPEPYKE